MSSRPNKFRRNANVPLLLLLLAFAAFLLFPCIVHAKRVLFLAPNFLPAHFELNARLADLAVDAGHQVHFVILQTDRHNNAIGLTHPECVQQANSRQEILAEPDLQCSYEFHEFNAQFHAEFDADVGLPNKWVQRAYDQNEQILRNEAFLVFKEFAKSPGTLARLYRAKFDVGIADSWDFGALYIFFLAGIKNALMANSIQLLPYQMDYAGTLAKLPENVPDVYATELGDEKTDGARQREITHLRTNNMQPFLTVHQEMDEWFHGEEMAAVLAANDGLFPWLPPAQAEWPNSRQLYRRVERLLANSMPQMSFPLADGQPANLRYVGGIMLGPVLRKAMSLNVDRSVGKQIIVSISPDLIDCQEMVSAKNRNVFSTFMKAFEQFPDYTFLFNCKRSAAMKAVKAPNVRVGPIWNLREKIASPQTRLVVSNCDNRMALASVAAGVPLICVPFYVDHFYNAAWLRRQQVARSLDITRITRAANSPAIVNELREMLNPNVSIFGGTNYLAKVRSLQQAMQRTWANAPPENVFEQIVNNVGGNAAVRTATASKQANKNQQQQQSSRAVVSSRRQA